MLKASLSIPPPHESLGLNETKPSEIHVNWPCCACQIGRKKNVSQLDQPMTTDL